jgi:hypothetical protein
MARTRRCLSRHAHVDVTTKLYFGVATLWPGGAKRRVHVRRFDYDSFPTEEAQHAFIRLWREVELLESLVKVELAARRSSKRGANPPPLPSSIRLDA